MITLKGEPGVVSQKSLNKRVISSECEKSCGSHGALRSLPSVEMTSDGWDTALPLTDNTIVLKASRKSNRKGLTIRKNFQYMGARTYQLDF